MAKLAVYSSLVSTEPIDYIPDNIVSVIHSVSVVIFLRFINFMDDYHILFNSAITNKEIMPSSSIKDTSIIMSFCKHV